MNRKNKILCASALPVLLLAACVLQPATAAAQMTSVGIDCSQINALQLMKQDNMRAGRALIECGVVRGGRSRRCSKEAKRHAQRQCGRGYSCGYPTHSPFLSSPLMAGGAFTVAQTRRKRAGRRRLPLDQAFH